MRYTSQYLEDEWNSSHVSYKYISWDFIQHNEDEEWDWDSISRYLNTTRTFMKNNPDEEWYWDSVSRHLMKHHPDKEKEKWMNNRRLQIIKAFQIQRHWRNCTSNPVYKLAQKLIQERLNN